MSIWTQSRISRVLVAVGLLFAAPAAGQGVSFSIGAGGLFGGVSLGFSAWSGPAVGVVTGAPVWGGGGYGIYDHGGFGLHRPFGAVGGWAQDPCGVWIDPWTLGGGCGFGAPGVAVGFNTWWRPFRDPFTWDPWWGWGLRVDPWRLHGPRGRAWGWYGSRSAFVMLRDPFGPVWDPFWAYDPWVPALAVGGGFGRLDPWNRYGGVRVAGVGAASRGILPTTGYKEPAGVTSRLGDRRARPRSVAAAARSPATSGASPVGRVARRPSVSRPSASSGASAARPTDGGVAARAPTRVRRGGAASSGAARAPRARVRPSDAVVTRRSGAAIRRGGRTLSPSRGASSPTARALPSRGRSSAAPSQRARVERGLRVAPSRGSGSRPSTRAAPSRGGRAAPVTRARPSQGSRSAPVTRARPSRGSRAAPGTRAAPSRGSRSAPVTRARPSRGGRAAPVTRAAPNRSSRPQARRAPPTRGGRARAAPSRGGRGSVSRSRGGSRRGGG